MLKRITTCWKKRTVRRTRQKEAQVRAKERNRRQFEYLARKGLRLPIYTL